MSNILTTDKKRLTLFEKKVIVNKNLPKWRHAEEGLSKTEAPKELNNGYINNNNQNIGTFFISSDPDRLSLNVNDVDSNVDNTTKWLPLYEVAEGVSFDTLAKAGIKDLTRIIAENKLKFVIGGYGSLGNTQFDTPLSGNAYVEQNKHTFFNVFKHKFMELFNTNLSKNKDESTIDALEFFSYVKLSAKESVSTYRDRVSDYLKEIHNAVTVGQTALLEDLLRGLVTNKYESVLFAEGLYYIVNEEQMVSFVKACEKGVKLDYIKNFTRPLPQTIVNKIEQVNQLEIFDNYVVLYYDPDGNVYKETAIEEAKRKDPIIFGVIAGSTKLYYIADWVDEYCDLTLEKFIDIIGINKNELHMDFGKPNFKPEIDSEAIVFGETKEAEKKKKRYYKKPYNKKIKVDKKVS